MGCGGGGGGGLFCDDAHPFSVGGEGCFGETGVGLADVVEVEFIEDVDECYIGCLADEFIEFAYVGVVAEIS